MAGAALVGSTIAHYRILERLGGGGMGEVYLAEDLRLGRRIALKALAPGVRDDVDARARLEREARAAAVLRSPHVAVTYDLIEHEAELFIVMEYVEGELLSSRIVRGPLTVPDALDIVLQVADALDDAHAHGIVHRDIKSANLMLTPRQLVKVLDFGLAKHLRTPSPAELETLAGTTLPGTVLGTLNYMAPEQLTGQIVDHRADLFSLGVVLYEMLATRLPFAGATPAEIADRVLNRDPEAIARYNYAVGAEVEAILRKALEKNPERRYQSARDLVIDVHHARRRAAGDGSSHTNRVWRPFSETLEANDATALAAAARAPAATMGGRLAVLTFANITADPTDDWVGQGIAESLTADLMRLESVSVVPRERIFELQRHLAELGRSLDERQAVEIARRLGASVVISGGYQRLGERIRITALVGEVHGARLVATVKLDGRMEDLFELQDRLVVAITGHLDAPVRQQDLLSVEGAGTQSMAAYQAYARGMLNLRLAGRDALDRAIALLEQALELDPQYVEAMVALANALEIKASFLALPELFARSLALTDEALRLRPDLADAHVQRGDTLLSLGRADEAIAALREGVRLQPDRAAAHGILARAYWLGNAQIDEAIEEFRETLRLNPEGGYTHLQLAMLETLRGRYAEAEAIAREAIRLQDQAMSGTTGLLIVGAHTRLGYVYYRQGRYEDAVREYRRELELVSVGDHLLRERTTIELHQKLGAAYRRQAEEATAAFHEGEALRLFDARLAAGADEPFTRYYIAALHALNGQAAAARRHLEHPLRALPAFTRWRLPRDPDFDPVRDDPAFAEAQ